MSKLFLSSTILGLLLFSITGATAATYNVTDLGTNIEARAINNNGQIVGSFATGDIYPFRDPPAPLSHAFLYANGTMTDLGSGKAYSNAYGLNNKGQIVGYSENQPFLYNGGEMSIVGEYGIAYAINDNRQVAGWCYSYENQKFSAFIYSEGKTTLIEPPNGLSCYASDINNVGQVAGQYDVPNGDHAFLYGGDVMTDLGTLGGRCSSANSINNLGQVVGSSLTLGNDSHAFLYRDGAMLDLGTLGGNYAEAVSINDDGRIVGSSMTASGKQHAFLNRDETMTDLNELIAQDSGWELAWARDINDLGQIIGGGYLNGEYHSFLLTPVPEPSVAFLSVSGLAGFLFLGWRRQKTRFPVIQSN
jgi:probable HAF family extracellular repeat protein